MRTLTVLPHSLACVERIFSLVNCVKTNTTNALKVETVKNLVACQTIDNKTFAMLHDMGAIKTSMKVVENGTVHRRYEKKNKELEQLSSLLMLMKSKLSI